jgi:hypothetical protein
MKPLELLVNTQGGQIVIDVPDEMRGKNLKVLVMEVEGDKIDKFSELPVKERLKLLEQYIGSAKYPNFPVDKYDVYDQ